ncbi:MAG: hypothetical protein H0X12_14115, partial [Nocardioides sp.]|nr:hypothetical protein [Nocardioides sp.]
TGVTGGKNQPRTIYSARTGEKLQSRKFDLYPTTVGMKGAKVLFSRSEGGTFWWITRTDTTTKVSKRLTGPAVDFRDKLMSSFTADVHEGGPLGGERVEEVVRRGLTRLRSHPGPALDYRPRDGGREVRAVPRLATVGVGVEECTPLVASGLITGTSRSIAGCSSRS